MLRSSVDDQPAFLQDKGVAGIDVTQQGHDVRWLDPVGRLTGRSYRVENTRAGFEQVLAAHPTPEVVIGLESTEPHWLPWAHWLAAQPGVTGVLVNPAHVKRAKELDDNTPTKSDAKDAGVIARLAMEGRFLPWAPRDDVWAQLQSLAVTRRQQRQAMTQWETRIAGWLARYFPEFLAVLKSWRGQAALWILDQYPLPAEACQAGESALATGMAIATHRRVGSKRARALWAAATTSIGVPQGAARARSQISGYLTAWRSAAEALRETERAQAEILARLEAAAWVWSIPGWGPVVTATVLGELGDLARLQAPRQTLKMARVNRTHECAGHHHGRIHISKRGRSGVRTVLEQAARRGDRERPGLAGLV